MNPISAARPRGGNGMDGGDTMMNADEPGAYDNRLSLTPADFPVVAKWRDGETYELSELGAAKIRQISPGEYEVIPATSAGENAAEVADADDESNPAMDEMMGRYRA